MIDAGRRSTVSRFFTVLSIATVLALPAVAGAQTSITAPLPVAGQNVNMVSGTGWPGGDPFLQRQNEPSCAVSTANPRHLLCGANDYRSVYLPGLPDGEETGDAWLGVYKSLDGAQTWRSTLLAGYPQECQLGQSCPVTPIRGLKAAADPVIRSAPAGVFYYTGIAFNRGSNIGKVFVSRFIDLNNQETFGPDGSDPIEYVDSWEIDSGTAGQFLDKPWSAIGRPTGGTCTIGGRTVPTTPVYFAWARFTGAKSSKIMFSRSLDCGQTWPAQTKLSESNSINQGTTVAVDPVTGYIYVAWRRFASSSDTDAIIVARSTDGGATFPNKDVRSIATIPFPFDQNVTETRFRTNALPTMAISVNAAGTRSWVHVAWSQRSGTTGSAGDARVVMSTSSDGVTWSSPAVVDGAAVRDDYGASFARGHQFMPQLAFANGKLMLLYYDQRLDHTIGLLEPNKGGEDGRQFVPDPATGRFYKEQRVKRGESDAEVFDAKDAQGRQLIDEGNLTQIRHTLDLRVAQADVTPLDSNGALAWGSARVSEFIFGTRGDEEDGDTIGGVAVAADGEVKRLQQLQFNPPNLPLFRQGQLPFIGDYVDLAVLPFVPDPSKPGGWAFNVGPSRSPVFYATWTSNQDVRPPLPRPDGTYDWSLYTPPPFSAAPGGLDPVDPSAPPATCVTGNEGTRNQNIYVSAITQGLSVFSPQNVKKLSATQEKAFVVTVGNATDKKRAVQLEILGGTDATLPPGVGVSFRNDAGFGPLSEGTVNPQATRTLQVEIAPRSSIARSVFVQLAGGAPDASLRVVVTELAAGYEEACMRGPAYCPTDPDGLSGFVRFNPPGSDPLNQPELTEIYQASVAPTALDAACDGSSANITSANITSANCPAANITSANITSANITSSHIANPDLANITSANITSANITSANITSANITSAPLANANITSANITSANITSAPISDATYTVTNTGDTTHSFHVKLVSNVPIPTTQPLQLVLAKVYRTPLGSNCELVTEPTALVQANVDDVTPAIQLVGTVSGDPNIPDPRTTNATVALAPGESAQITIRGGNLDLQAMTDLASHIAPVVIPHGGDGTTYAAALLVTSNGDTLGPFQVGILKTALLTAVGGSGTYTWSLVNQTANLGNFLLSSNGTLTGTPTGGGTGTLEVQVKDAGTNETATQKIQVTIGVGVTQLVVTPMPASAYVGQSVTFSVTASVVDGSTDAPVPTGSVALSDGSTSRTQTLSGGTTAFEGVTFAAAGPASVTISYAGDANYGGSSTTLSYQVLSPNVTATTISSSANPSVFGQPVTFTATVASGAGVPAGVVQFSLDGAPLGSAIALDGNGKASVVTTAALSVGPHPVTAAFTSASLAFANSTATFTQNVNKVLTSTTLTSSKNPSAYGEAVTFTATVAAAAGGGQPSGSVSFYDNGVPLGGPVTLNLGRATFTTSTTTPLTTGTHPITATYAGDVSFTGSTSTALNQVVGALYRFVGFGSPLATTGETLSISGNWTFSRVLPVKWQLLDTRTNTNVTKLEAVKKLYTVLAPKGTCPTATTGSGYRTFLLYTPTSGAAGGSTFRSSSTGYTFNWDATKGVDTNGAPATAGCYWLRLELEDGTIRTTQVQLK